MKLDLVIVTGAGRGIGRAIALEMGQNFSVIGISRILSEWQFDFRVRSEQERLRLKLLDVTQGLRVVIVLAAGSLNQDYRESWEVNVLGNLMALDGCLPAMKAAKFGRILFFAGGGAAYANPLFPAYSASKAALVRITENLHEELKDQGDFAVTILSPGAVDTDMLAQVRAAGGEIRTPVPMEEPVNFAREFLCSENAARLSGKFVHVRDDWKRVLDADRYIETDPNCWKLRRVDGRIE